MRKHIFELIKWIIGIDVSKDELKVCFGGMDGQNKFQILRQSVFKNDACGYAALLEWARKQQQAQHPLLFAMEATGIYHEGVAYFLHQKGQQVSVQLPNKTKHYAKSLAQKSKTDKIDAAMLCRMGLERNLEIWQPASALMLELKRLSREHTSYKNMGSSFKSQLHAYEHSHRPIKDSIKRLKKQIKLIEQQIKEIEQQIDEVLNKDQALKQRVEKIAKAKGIGIMSVVKVVAETDGFALVKNVKQLTSYAGLDVKMNESGLKKGKTTISKQGNSHIRAALYPPAMSAIQYNLAMKSFYDRIMQRHTCGKIGIVAVERKLLALIYSLWKSGQEYDPNRWKTKVAPPMAELHEMN